MTDPMHFTRAVLAMLALLFTAPLAAQAPDMSAFAPGPVFADFGPHAPVEGVEEFLGDSEFRIAFDVSTQADEGTRNHGFESAARFINMHADHRVDPANIDIAVVVHGKAVFDLTTRDGNGSAVMVREMLDHGVRFIVCGQSAAAYGVTQADLIGGVELHLSAMTAHAQLQQRGYTLNPF